MPTTRKKIIKTVYKDEESGNEGCDFSDSGSDAVITDHTSSDDEEDEYRHSSDDEFQSKKPKSKCRTISNKKSNVVKKNKTNFAKPFIQKIMNQKELDSEENVAPVLFSVKDLTDTDKLLPILNLSESDSSDDESPTIIKRNNEQSVTSVKANESDDEVNEQIEYKDIWSNNLQNDSAEVAKKTFLELEQQKLKLEETKLSVLNYAAKNDKSNECDVKDLLALGEEEVKLQISSKKKKKYRKHDSDSEIEDWEEVMETNEIPQQGLQLIVDIPQDICKRTKKLDVEMMMKRKINRVKKEYQVYMHKVHVLCWLGHGNYVSQVLNDPTVLAAALSVVPSKDSYPGNRVDMKYLEEITKWFNGKVTLNQDKGENKFKPKSPPLKNLLLQQIKGKVFTTNKYIVFVFVSMLRSLGLQCRVMFNFVTLPIKPPTSELCSLSRKDKEDKKEKNIEAKSKVEQKDSEKSKNTTKQKKDKIPQLDGNYDTPSDTDNIMQVDGGDDNTLVKTRRQKCLATKKCSDTIIDEENISPPKRTRRNLNTHTEKANGTKTSIKKLKENNTKVSQEPHQKGATSISSDENNIRPKETRKSLSLNRLQPGETTELKYEEKTASISSRRTRSNKSATDKISSTTHVQQSITETKEPASKKNSKKCPKIVVTSENNDNVSSKYFDGLTNKGKTPIGRKRSRTSEPKPSKDEHEQKNDKKTRTRSAHAATENKSEYFNSDTKKQVQIGIGSVMRSRTIKESDSSAEDVKRVSHKDIAKKKPKAKNDVTNDLINIIKGRVKEEKIEAKKGIVKSKIKQESDEDSDYLAVESPKSKGESDDDFKPIKTIINKPKNRVKKIDRRVVSTDDELPLNKMDVWCEVYVEELEEWVPVDVIKGKVHCVNELYNRATHPVKYVIGWDNNNYLKDLTRRYVPHWNTVTRKQRVEPAWWNESIKPWIGPKTARDKEEDERLNRMLLEAPLPTSISEYKNHPLYALKRHLLKFEAIYPSDAAVLGFVRSEPVYARECVYVCKSREIWLKDAKVVKLGEEPYKIVKARPKWDKLSNKMVTDKALEIFGPWQVQDYEPPTAENGIVPRNPYGNVELFKECMLPKGTVLIKLHGLNRIAKKLNIDCAPAMTGFDYNGGYCHPVYDGFVVCKEFEDIITEAWVKDQEEQERKEEEKIDARVYGNWRKLIRGLLIKERLKAKYGFEQPSTSKDKTKAKGPRLVVKKT